MQKNKFLKVQILFLDIGKDFIELKDRELKDGELKIKKEIEELFFKLMIVSLDDMDKFEQKEMKKIRSIKNTWFYIPEPTKKSRCQCVGDESN